MLATLLGLGYETPTGATDAMKLFQYWDQASPPAEVAGWIADFATRNPGFEHVLLNEETAAGFIATHHGPRWLAAFRTCAVPAMQADYIRLCVLDTFGGVYVDADNQSLRPLAELIDQAPHALMFTWGALLNNGFLMFRRAGHPFIRACLALTTANIEARRFDVEFTSTGPGVANAVRAVLEPSVLPAILADFDNPLTSGWGFAELIEHARVLIQPTAELLEGFREITLMNALAAGSWIGAEQPAYKAGERHWLNWKGPIYVEGERPSS